MSTNSKTVKTITQYVCMYVMVMVTSACCVYCMLENNNLQETPMKVKAMELPTVQMDTVVEILTKEEPEIYSGNYIEDFEIRTISFVHPVIPVYEEVTVDEVIEIDIDARVEEHIKNGDFTREDFLYLTSVGQEGFTTYEGFHAVGSVVMNRLESNPNYSSIKEVVMAANQFNGFHDPYSDTKRYQRYCTEEVKAAAIDLLLGDESSVGSCIYFYGRVPGYDMWAESSIDEFYVINGNVFYNGGKENKVHNQQTARPEDAIVIYDHLRDVWLYDHYIGVN